MLLDAGMRVLKSNGYSTVSVSDIVEEAKVSRRAFYRHFETKDSLVCALFRQDSDQVAEQLRAVVEQAPSGVDAVDLWLVQFMDPFVNPRRVSRVRFLNSDVVRRTLDFDVELRRIDDLYSASLAEAITRGVKEGVLRSVDPRADARVVLAVAEHVGQRYLDGHVAGSVEALQMVRRFCWPALGLG